MHTERIRKLFVTPTPMFFSMIMWIAVTAVFVVFYITNTPSYSLSVYSDGDKVHIVKGNDEYVFVTNDEAFKNLTSREALFTSKIGRAEVQIVAINGRPVLIINNASVKEVVAKEDAVIVLEDCTLKEKITTNGDHVMTLVNRGMKTWGDLEKNIRPAWNIK